MGGDGVQAGPVSWVVRRAGGEDWCRGAAGWVGGVVCLLHGWLGAEVCGFVDAGFALLVVATTAEEEKCRDESNDEEEGQDDRSGCLAAGKRLASVLAEWRECRALGLGLDWRCGAVGPAERGWGRGVSDRGGGAVH